MTLFISASEIKSNDNVNINLNSDQNLDKSNASSVGEIIEIELSYVKPNVNEEKKESATVNIFSKILEKGAVSCGLILLNTFNPYVLATMSALIATNTAIDVWKNYNKQDTWRQFGLKTCQTPLITLTKAYGPTIAGKLIGAYTGFSYLGLIGEGLTAVWATSDITCPVINNATAVISDNLKQKIDDYKKEKYQIINHHQFDDDYVILDLPEYPKNEYTTRKKVKDDFDDLDIQNLNDEEVIVTYSQKQNSENYNSDFKMCNFCNYNPVSNKI